MKTSEVDKQLFFAAVNSIDYRDDDIKEANQFGCSSIEMCYKKANHAFAKYFIIEYKKEPVVTVMLQRDGHIIFFISKIKMPNIKLIRTLRRLAKKESKCAGPIVTKTASWYIEALRVNKLVGFWPYKLYSTYGFYVFGYNKIEKLG